MIEKQIPIYCANLRNRTLVLVLTRSKSSPNSLSERILKVLQCAASGKLFRFSKAAVNLERLVSQQPIELVVVI